MGIGVTNKNLYQRIPLWLVGMVVGIAAIGIVCIHLLYKKYFG